MTLSGAKSGTTITDASGNYTFTGLDNGSYTITPSRTGFTFSPTSSPQTVSGANITGRQFYRYGGTSSHSQYLRPSNDDRLWIIRRHHGIERSKLRNDHNQCQRRLHFHWP